MDEKQILEQIEATGSLPPEVVELVSDAFGRVLTVALGTCTFAEDAATWTNLDSESMSQVLLKISHDLARSTDEVDKYLGAFKKYYMREHGEERE